MSPTQDASALARSIGRGDVLSADVVDDQLERIQRLNPPLNAVITLDAEGARRQAREADTALQRGESCGPLHGVPVTIKDSFETRGLRTVSGYSGFRHRVPRDDAAPVARLRQAGAIVLGKTNLPPLANGIQTNNSVFGRTNNPWDLRRTPGGSSGGAAAAISAALTYLEMGSDIGGSIRIPAHFCGVYGLKTTAGRISGKGHVASARPLTIPPGWEALLELASFGPIARSIADLRLAFVTVAEPGTPNLESAPAARHDTLRIAWTCDFGGAPLSQDIRAAVQDFAAALTRKGWQVEQDATSWFDFDEGWWVSGVCLGAINTLFQPAATRWLRRLLSPGLSMINRRDPLLRGLFTGAALDFRRLRDALERRARLIEQLERFLTTRDVWICPVFPVSAFTHRSTTAAIEVDDRSLSQLRANLLHSIIFNLTGHPVVTMPVGCSSEGLPVGVQVVGRRWQELALLEAAEQLASVTKRYRAPPGY